MLVVLTQPINPTGFWAQSTKKALKGWSSTWGSICHMSEMSHIYAALLCMQQDCFYVANPQTPSHNGALIMLLQGSPSMVQSYIQNAQTNKATTKSFSFSLNLYRKSGPVFGVLAEVTLGANFWYPIGYICYYSSCVYIFDIRLGKGSNMWKSFISSRYWKHSLYSKFMSFQNIRNDVIIQKDSNQN